MTKEKTRRNKGITLIALIITIIVMLILVGVTINVVLNGGIFITAKDATKETERQSIYEQIIGNLEYGDSGKINLKNTFSNIENAFENINLFEPEKAEAITDETESILFEVVGKRGAYTYNLTEYYVKIVYDVAKLRMKIGDYVNYNAGTWDETKAIPTADIPYTFGGYNEGDSRNSSASGLNINVQDGWRIFDISDDRETITLISSGCPEIFYHGTDLNNSLRMLNGGGRDYTDYINEDQYATGAKTLNKSELLNFYKKNITSDTDYVWIVKGNRIFSFKYRNKIKFNYKYRDKLLLRIAGVRLLVWCYLSIACRISSCSFRSKSG